MQDETFLFNLFPGNPRVLYAHTYFVYKQTWQLRASGNVDVITQVVHDILCL